MNLVAKLLMNSLYGRFGMDYSLGTTTIVNAVDMKTLLARKPSNKIIMDIEPRLSEVQIILL